jgi:hypothetical protein
VHLSTKPNSTFAVATVALVASVSVAKGRLHSVVQTVVTAVTAGQCGLWPITTLPRCWHFAITLTAGQVTVLMAWAKTCTVAVELT